MKGINSEAMSVFFDGNISHSYVSVSRISQILLLPDNSNQIIIIKVIELFLSVILHHIPV